MFASVLVEELLDKLRMRALVLLSGETLGISRHFVVTLLLVFFVESDSKIRLILIHNR